MLSLKANKRSEKKLRELRENNLIPAVLYGPEIDNLKLQVDLVDFQKTHNKAGDSSLFSLEVEDKKFLVLIRDTQFGPVSGRPIHVDFYQPSLKENVEVEVPVIFKGESLAVKNLGGTLVKNLSELPVKALPQDLPKEIEVDIGSLKTFDDKISIRDLDTFDKFEIMKDQEDVIASVSRPAEIKEEEVELGELGEMGEMEEMKGIEIGEDVKEDEETKEDKEEGGGTATGDKK